MSTKVLWFSRHDMTPDQRAALGDRETDGYDAGDDFEDR